MWTNNPVIAASITGFRCGSPQKTAALGPRNWGVKAKKTVVKRNSRRV